KKYYKDGYRHGLSKMYYPSGELYRESPYSMGKLEGIRKSYYKDGTLMASSAFRNGYAGLGLKEFNSSGKLLEDQPVIIVNPVNRLALENKYVLELKLSPPQAGTVFYIGDLKDDKYIHIGLLPIEPVNGKANFTIPLKKGDFRMETLTISAQYKTNKSNYGVVSRKYNLAIDNK
ncbi:MAG: toxin-antitoxin system YwqK family antitoxin, partial [Bacteroidota bacterium]